VRPSGSTSRFDRRDDVRTEVGQARPGRTLNASEGHERKVAVEPFIAATMRDELREDQEWRSKVKAAVLNPYGTSPASNLSLKST